MYTIEKDFGERLLYSKEKEIVAEGFSCDINYSSILTKLIKECGRLCERYASDLFIDWRGIDESLKSGTMETSTYLFGIREDGVDHTAFVLARYEHDRQYAFYEYRKIYRLDVIVEEGYVTMSLYEICKPLHERTGS